MFPYKIDVCVRYLEFAAKDYLLDGGTNNLSIVEQTFEIMARMKLDPTVYYKIEDGKLYLWLTPVYDLYTKYRKDYAIVGEVLTYAQFKEQLIHTVTVFNPTPGEEKAIKQPEIIERMAQSGKTAVEVKREIKAEEQEERRRENAEKIKELSSPLDAQGLFQTIVIDPPWDHGDEGDINFRTNKARIRQPETKRRYGTKWKRIRKQYAQSHPFCEQCFDNGIYVPVEEVHHIKPLSEGGTHDAENLISLCRSCHARLHAQRGDRWHRNRKGNVEKKD